MQSVTSEAGVRSQAIPCGIYGVLRVGQVDLDNFRLALSVSRGRDGSVGIATRCGLYGPRIEFR